MDDLNEVNGGAKFVRADLHIHSYGDDGSFDVKDTNMTPENIVDTAIQSDLKVISITDHNEITNSKVAVDYAVNKNVLVIPGIEVSTTQGHLLVYFKKFQELRNFFGKLTITEDKHRCNNGVVECLDFANQYNGFGVLAHIELDSGFEKVIGRFSGVIEDVISHPNLLALEISRKESVTLYTDNDDLSERKNLIKIRRERLNLEGDMVLPKIMSSDSHSLDKLGRNASGDKKLTRFKVDELSFESIRIALLSYQSRVRIEDLLPERIPKFIGLNIKGGILDGQTVRFSENLNCIIGGRGAGKSTLLESLREASGNKSTASVVDSDVWPDEIGLIYEDETGKRTEFKRSKNDLSFNVTDQDDGIDHVVIESYGQGETADTIQHSDEDPRALLSFLDSFIDVGALALEDGEVCDLLLDNQSETSKLRIEISHIPETQRQLTNLSGKKKRLESDQVGDLVRYQTSLVKERSLRTDLISDLTDLVKSYRDAFKDDELFTHFSNMSENEIVVGKAEFIKVKEIVKEFSDIVDSQSSQLDTALQSKVEALKVQLNSWKARESQIQTDIDKKKEELEAAGIPFDIGKINQIANDLDYYEKRLKKLKEDEKKLKSLDKERSELIKRRKAIKQSIFNKRLSFSIRINENLKNSVDGLHVSASYSQGCFSAEFEQSIKQMMDWRTSQVRKSEIIASSISPLEFCDGVRKNNLSVLKGIEDSEGDRVFSDSDINSILEKAANSKAYEDFETLKYEDRPNLQVTKIIKNGESVNRITRSISQLSLGQQQSILLAILIQSNSVEPLLIDQPEDNLDSEFIYKTIVDNLKRIKETRQVIIVTHNANIAVLGDAELVIPLKSTSEKTYIMDRGSIDRDSVRESCCAILEGGRRAFLSRQKIYNLSR